MKPIKDIVEDAEGDLAKMNLFAIMNLFSTPVWHIDGTPEDILDEMIQGAYACKENVKTANRSNVSGYQSPCFTPDLFHKGAFEYLENQLKDTCPKFKLDVWWFNISGKGSYNVVHTHPKCDLALIWYLTDDDNKLSLCDPLWHSRAKLYAFLYGTDETPLRKDRNYHDVKKMNAKKGDIIIFPGDLAHYVETVETEQERISISMNLTLP